MAKTVQVWEVYMDNGDVYMIDDAQMKEIMKDAGLIYLSEEKVINTKSVVSAYLTEQYDTKPEPEPEPENGGDN